METFLRKRRRPGRHGPERDVTPVQKRSTASAWLSRKIRYNERNSLLVIVKEGLVRVVDVKVK